MKEKHLDQSCPFRPNQLAQLLLSFENDQFEVNNRKRPKYKKSTWDFPKNKKLGSKLSFQTESTRTTPSELRERSIWSWHSKKDQNVENPRKIFIFSKKSNQHDFAVQILAHNSFWAPRTIGLKMDIFPINFGWFSCYLFSRFTLVILETFLEISIDHNFLNICRIEFFFDVLKSS